jgi:hypothetical protein
MQHTFFVSLSMLMACQPQWIDVDDTKANTTDPADTNDTEEQEEEVNEEQSPPELRVIWSETAFPGQSVRFDARPSTDPERGDLDFEWQCSNGDLHRTAVFDVELPTEDLTCDLTATSSISDLSTSGTYITQARSPEDKAQWTFLVYIAGDNNLEQAGIDDINEMEIVGSSPDVNIVVEIDRSNEYYDGHGNWTGAKRYYIVGDNSDDIVSLELETLGEVDSGSPEHLSEFFTWGATAYPAEHYALIMWNHGWSWSFAPQNSITKGIMSDDQTGSSISVVDGELTQILEDWTETIGQPIDLLGMDACIMQSWEIATEVSDYASVYVASQDYVSWYGWNYTDTLQDLVNNPEMSSLELGESISQRFWETDDLTISVVDLDQIQTFNQYLNTFAQTLSEDNPRMVFPAARNSYSYDGSNDGTDHDLLGIVEYIVENHDNPEVVSQGQDVIDNYDALVPTNYVQEYLDTANGLSIYSPPRRNSEMDPRYSGGSWTSNNYWDELLEAAYAQ